MKKMRRRDREMDRIFAFDVIDRSCFGVLSLWSDSEQKIVSVPLSIAREGDFLYFHSAMEGEKVVALQENDWGTVVFVTDVQVPDFTSDEEVERELAKGNERFLGQRIYTTEFASAIVRGRVEILEDRDDKIHGLTVICEKFTPTKMKWVQRAAESSMNRVVVYRIHIKEIQGKRKKFGKNGEELKFKAVDQ